MSTHSSSTKPSPRIAALRRTGLLDRPGSEQFGHLTDHVRMVMNVPVAIVSIVDEHRQVFAGHSGLPEPWASAGETPITHSFCQHVVDRASALAISDANTEPLVRENLAIRDLGVVAYLGVPLRLPTGEVVGALAAIDTERRDWTAHDLRVLRSTAQIVEKEIGISASEAKYRQLFTEMGEGFYVAESVRDERGELTDIRFDDVNPAFERLTGLTSAATLGATLSAVAPGSHARLLPVFGKVLDGGLPTAHVSPSTVAPGRWFENRLSPIDSERLVGFFSDVTERRELEQRQEVLQLELGHRLKNMFMMIQALAMQTLRQVTERAPVEALEKRIQALSSAHDMLLRKHWHGASLREVADAALAMSGVDTRVDMGGPDTELGPKATLALSLLLHELATNALKYGAFSNPAGRAQLVWSTDDGVLHLAWIESGGPRVSEPTQKGFGSRLIQMGLGSGRVRTEFDPDGFSLELSASLSHLQSDS